MSLLLAAAVVALFGAYHMAKDTNADDAGTGEQEFSRDKCIENCG